MRTRSLIGLLALLVVCNAGESGQAEPEYIRPPELAPLPHAFGVAVPADVELLEVTSSSLGAQWRTGSISSNQNPGASLGDQMDQAIAHLLTAVSRAGATPRDIVKLDVFFVGDRFEQMFLLHERLANASLGTLVGSEIGIAALSDPRIAVEIRATVLRPPTTPAAPGQRGRRVLAAGLTAIQRNWSVRGVGDLAVQMQTALGSLETVLAKAGGTRADVTNVRVFYIPQKDAPSATDIVHEQLTRFFGQRTFGRDFVASRTIGTAAERVLIEAEAMVREREGGVQPPKSEAEPAARRALALLETSTKAWMRSGYCFSCHHQALMVRVARVARDHGLQIDESLLLENARRSLGYIGSLDDVVQGLDFIDPALVNGLQLAAAHDIGIAANATYSALARRLARLQLPSGNWMTTDRRPPQAASSFTATAAALDGIVRYLPASALRDETLRRAREWLASAAPGNTEEQSMALMGLKSTSAPDSLIASRARELLAAQRPDGGWSQIAGHKSDAYATGQALVALIEAGAIDPSVAEYRRGVAFLVETQQLDGSWLVETRMRHPLPLNPPDFDIAFPHERHKVMSFMGTAWATMALAFSLERTAVSPRATYREAIGQLRPADPEPWVNTAIFGSLQDLKAALDGGLDPNATTKHGTPLLLLAALDDAKVRLLLDRGADINVQSKSRFTAVMVAANHTATTDTVRMLLDRGAQLATNPGRFGTPTALYLATAAGDVATARLLVQRGDDPKRMWLRFGSQRYTPIQNAVNMRDADLVRLLARAGADVNERTNNRGSATLLSLAVLSNAPGVVSALLEAGADANAPDDLGMTPLLYAAMSDSGAAHLASLLLGAGARRDVRNRYGTTPEEAARSGGDAGLTSLLAADPGR